MVHDDSKLIWYIHGANSSPLSFSWIKQQLPAHTMRNISYSADNPVANTIKCLQEKADSEQQPIHIISHSLGGIIAVSLARLCSNVNSVVTMSTPFGGSKMADRLRWWYPCQMFEDIYTGSRTIQNLQLSFRDVPVLSFVTTGGGVQMMQEPNDGVVTVESQLRLSGARYIHLPLNHFEVLLSPVVIGQIKDFFFHVTPVSK
jgi:pimeloyl-ACP methyl ester carboxylesterase